MNSELNAEHCKKCGKKLQEDEYVFMGYCEQCYNEKHNDSNFNQEKDDNAENNVITKTNLIVSIISFAIAVIIDATVFIPEISFPISMIGMTFGLIWAYLSRYIGLKKNIYSGYVWGYFLGIIGLIIICILPGENKTENYSNNNYKLVSNADEIKKYKELLDMGAITQEEYDKKKKELLNL